jgi:hypothetical protein
VLRVCSMVGPQSPGPSNTPAPPPRRPHQTARPGHSPTGPPRPRTLRQNARWGRPNTRWGPTIHGSRPRPGGAADAPPNPAPTGWPVRGEPRLPRPTAASCLQRHQRGRGLGRRPGAVREVGRAVAEFGRGHRQDKRRDGNRYPGRPPATARFCARSAHACR